MKKLIAILAVLAIACGAAFADFDLDWSGNNGVTNNADDNGFSVTLSNNDVSRGLDKSYDGLVNPADSWLLNPNDELTLSIDGIQNMDWSGYDPYFPTNGWGGDGVGLYVWIGDPYDYNSPVMSYEIPLEVGDYTSFESFLENGVTFTGQDLMDAMRADLAGRSVYGVQVNIVNSKSTANDAGTLTANLKVTPYVEEPEEETEVPEPATYAYAAMGLMSVLGMKRRIRK